MYIFFGRYNVCLIITHLVMSLDEEVTSLFFSPPAEQSSCETTFQRSTSEPLLTKDV